MQKIFLFFFLVTAVHMGGSQTGVGIGIYPTGTETGFGLRSGKETRLALDVRATKSSLFKNSKASTFISECSLIYRLIFLEKVRFHLGLGARVDWMCPHNYYGVVLPVGVEAFPFPFQNAGLFFEAAPCFTVDADWRGGIRTVAGFVFYFPTKKKKKTDEKL